MNAKTKKIDAALTAEQIVDIRTELKRAFNENWQTCGYDIIEAHQQCGGDGNIPREEVVDVLIDQMRNQAPWREFSEETKAYWEEMAFQDMIALGNEAMQFEYYGL